MKKSSRLLSFLLIFAMCLSMVSAPTFVSAEETGSTEAEKVTITLNGYPLVGYRDDGDTYYRFSMQVTAGMTINEDPEALAEYEALVTRFSGSHELTHWVDSTTKEAIDIESFKDIRFSENSSYSGSWDGEIKTIKFQTDGYFNDDENLHEITIQVPISQSISSVLKYAPYPNFQNLEGMTFDFWKRNVSDIEEYSILGDGMMGMVPPCDMTFTASYKSGNAADYCVVQYHPNGGVFSAGIEEPVMKEYRRDGWGVYLDQDEPTKEGYLFAGWSSDPEGSTGLYEGGVTSFSYSSINHVYAIYRDYENYTVTWKNYDGSTLEVDENVRETSMPSYDGDTPVKPSEGYYDYRFIGWSPEISEVTGDTIYTAQYEICNYCGDNAYWQVVDNALIISGTGNINDYAEEPAPWSGIDNITSVRINEGITKVGIGAFSGMTEVSEITIFDTLTEISKNAFENCEALTDIYYSGTQDEWNGIRVNVGNDPLTNARLHLLNDDRIAQVIYTEGNNTLTFLYGPGLRVGDNYNGQTVTAVFIDFSQVDSHDAWNNSFYFLNVKHISIDSSFENYQPTSTKYWFNGFNMVEDIVGLEYLDTSRVEDMSYMFSYMGNKLTALDLSHFDTSNVTNMSHMFPGIGDVEIDLSSFDTRKVTNMSFMFDGSTIKQLDLSTFDMTNVEDISYMFYACDLKTIYCANEQVDWSSIPYADGVFDHCDYLVGKSGSTTISYSDDKITGEYAKSASLGGYFTPKQEAQCIHPEESIIIDPAVPATCTTAGLTEGSHCGVCGEVLVAQEEVAKLAHTPGEPQNVIEPTETEDGYSGDIYCTVCNTLIEEGHIIPASAESETVLILNKEISIDDDEITVFSFTPDEEGFYELIVQGGLANAILYDDEGNKLREVSSYYSSSSMFIFMEAGRTYHLGIKGKKTRIVKNQPSGVYFDSSWTIDSNYYLHIGGSGPMESFGMSSAPPWYIYADLIVGVIIEDGITNIGNYAFCDLANATSIEIADSVTEIGKYAFSKSSFTEVVIGENVQSVGEFAFNECTALTSVDIRNPQVSMGKQIFRKCSSLATVLLPQGLQTIPSACFFECSSLREISIPSTVVEIGANAFYKCGLEQVILPPDLTIIDRYVFHGCPLTYVKIGSQVTTIREWAFGKGSEDSEMTVEMPLSVSCIENGAFANRSNFMVYYNGTVDQWFSFDNSLASVGYDGRVVCVSALGTWGDDESKWILHQSGSLIIYGTGTINSTSDDVWQEYADSITRVIIVDSTVAVKRGAFDYLSNTEKPVYHTADVVPASPSFVDKIYIDWGVRLGIAWVIDSDGLFWANGAGQIIRNGDALWDDSISLINAVIIDEGITSVPRSAFTGAPVVTVSLPESVVSIEELAFSECAHLKSIDLPNNLQTIGSNAFYSSGLQTISIPETVSFIGSQAFGWSRISSTLHLPSSIQTIEREAFWNCNLTDIIIDEGITIIPEGCFGYNENLTHVSIPESVISIEKRAFDCPNISTIDYGGSELTWNSISIDSGNDALLSITPNYAKSGIDGVCGPNLTWHLEDGVLTISGEGAMDDFVPTSIPWKDYASVISEVVFEDSVTSVGNYAFYGCEGVENISLSNTLIAIGTYAFINCSKLRTIDLPDSLESIGKYSFSGCSSLCYISIPEGVVILPEEMISDCSSLKTVYISKSVETIDEYAFFGCTAITDVFYSSTQDDWDKINIKDGNDPILNARLHVRKWSVAPGIVIGAEGISEGYQVYIGSADQNIPLWTVAGAGTNGLDGERFLIANEALNDAVAFTDASSSLANYFDSTFTDKEEVIFTTGANPEYIYSSEIIETYFPDPSSRAIGKAWWLADSGSTGMGKIVDANGVIVEVPATDTYYARPAFNMQSEGVLFTSAANGGKASGDVSEYCLVPVSVNEEGIWKLTLKDSSYTFTASVNVVNNQLANSFGYSSWPIEIQYSGAKAAENEFVSVMLADEEGNVLYYGHLASGSAEGTQTLMLPTELAVGNYSLHVFAEHINEGNSADLASDFSTINLQVSNPLPVTIQLQPGEGTGDSIDVDGDYLTGDIYAAPECTFTAPEGKTFDAWVTNDEAGTVYHVGDEIVLADTELILTATWKELPTLAVYSTTTNCTGSVVNISAPDGPFYPGDSVTLTAIDQNNEGFAFMGWYLVTETTNGQVSAYGDKVASTLVYTFEIQDSIQLAAVYESKGMAYVRIDTINGGMYRVSTDPQTIKSGGTIRVPVGTNLTISAEHPETLLHWQNESNKILSTGSDVTITVIGKTSVTMVSNTAIENQAFIQFVSDYNQVLLYDQISENSYISYPTVPTKIGYLFDYWVIEGSTEEATPEVIKDQIGTKSVITLKPKYTRDLTTKLVTIKYLYNEQPISDEFIGEPLVGSEYRLTLPQIDGYEFKCWTDESGRVLSYADVYSVKVLKDTSTYIAVYVEEGTPVERVPVVVITDMVTQIAGTKYKISAVAAHSVPDGYELEEYGILAGPEVGDITEDQFVVGSSDTRIKKYAATDMSSYTYTFTANVSDPNRVIYFRGYVTFRDVSTGNSMTYYSDICHGSYNSLNQ